MKKRRKSGLSTHPFALWTGLAMKTADMMTASAQVIAARTDRMRAAKLPLSAKDATEFRRMVQEKGEAAAEAGLAVALPWSSQMIALMPDMLRLAASPTLPVLAARQAKLGRKLQKTAAIVGHKAVAPFAKRAKANARRLAKS